jgi:hypothetical protein
MSNRANIFSVRIILRPLWILEKHFVWKPFLHRLLELSPLCFVLSFRGPCSTLLNYISFSAAYPPPLSSLPLPRHLLLPRSQPRAPPWWPGMTSHGSSSGSDDDDTRRHCHAETSRWQLYYSPSYSSSFRVTCPGKSVGMIPVYPVIGM